MPPSVRSASSTAPARPPTVRTMRTPSASRASSTGARLDTISSRDMAGTVFDRSIAGRSMPYAPEAGPFAAEHGTPEATAEVAARRPAHDAEEARRRQRRDVACERPDDVVETTPPVRRVADLLVEPAHDEGRAVVERRG